MHLCSLAGKSEFEASLKTKDFSLALEKHGEVEPYYQNLMEKHRGSKNHTSASDLSYEVPVRMAAMQGRTYKPIDELIKKTK